MIEKIKFSKENKENLFKLLSDRSSKEDLDKLKIVKNILKDIKNNGDKALLEYTNKFDSKEIKDIRVSKEEIEKAYLKVEKEFIENIKEAKKNIEEYHKMQKQQGYILKKENGVFMGQRVIPLESIGVYVPGGTAAFPSSVLMYVIPA